MFTFFSEKPAQVETPMAESSATECLLSWIEPELSDGQELFGYKVLIRSVESQEWQSASDEVIL